MTQDIRKITVTALMAALIFVLTVVPRVPTPVGGYIHLGDAGVNFAALAFGPWVATFSGGVGTALADLMGYPQWAIFSLIVHGLQGLAIGWIAQKELNVWRGALAVIAGTAIVVAGYFIAGAILEGAAVAILEILPNTIQGVSGGLIGIPLYLAVRKAYPPLLRYNHSSS